MVKRINKLKIVAVLLLSLVVFSASAQSKEKKAFIEEISLAYFGERLSHPGFKIEFVKTFGLKSDSLRYIHRIDYGVALAGYIHSRNHVGVRTLLHTKYIYQTRKGYEYGGLGELGYMRRFYNGKVFQVDDNGNVEKQLFAGQNAFTYGVHFVFAKRPRNMSSLLQRWFIQFGAFWESNYNGYHLMHPSISMGLSFSSSYFKRK